MIKLNGLISFENISYSIEENKLFSTGIRKTILDEISFEINDGTIFGITGESGSGKTTLIKLMANIYQPTNGKISYKFPQWENGKSNVQVLFQNSEDLINPVRKIKSQLQDIENNTERISEVFEVLSLNEGLLERRGMELSGGERQRIALSKLLLVRPKVLVCDEPFSAQDPASKLNFVELFKKINRKLNITVVCVSHEIDILKLFVTDLLVLYSGRIAETGNSKIIFEKPFHPYTDFLLRAVEYNLSERDLFGRSDSQNNKYGCPYYPECAVKLEKCKTSIEKVNFEKRTVYCNNPL